MKVLFISKGDLPDYQSDTIIHGGRSVLGENFVDANFPWYMYKKEKVKFWNTRVPDGGNSYGRGFTLHGTLEDIKIDREDIREKISTRFFDCIIYGSITRCDDYVNEVIAHYPKEKIFIVDGEDGQQIRHQNPNTVTLFKRELDVGGYWVRPISFGAPKEKIVNSVPTKTQEWGSVIPGKIETYTFTDESSYYADYQKSYFALTHKKGGWDCMRHYEILMNGCVPYFPDIDGCPARTLVDFPKDLCREANLMVKSGELSDDLYYTLADKFLKYTKERLTTDAVFSNMISILK